MFNKKPRRNFRQRKESSSDEEENQKNNEDGGDADEAPVVVNKQLKVAQGRGISCSSKQELTPPRLDSSDELEEKEEKRKDKDGGKKKTNAALSFSDDKEAEEPVFKLKKSSDKAVLFQVRKKESSPAKTTTGKTARPDVAADSPRRDHERQAASSSDDDDDDDDDDDVDDKNDDNDSDEDDSGSSSLSSTSDLSCSSAKPVIIPSAKQIQEAKKQRQASRGKKEFIPLSRDGRSSAGSTPDHYSRGDDDEEEERVDYGDDDEPDDHERRIEFAPRLKSIRERIAEKLGESDESLSGSEEEEQELWEEMQIGKGVKRRPGDQSPSGSDSSSSVRSLPNRRRRHKNSGARIPKTLPPVSVSMVKRRISGKLDSLREVFRARQAELRRMEGDVESAKTSVETLEESSSEKQLKFYRGMTHYVDNLVECLREKVVEINSLELELHTLLSDHTEALLVQRRQKVKEEADVLQQLSYGSDEQSRNSTDGAETQSVAEESVDVPEDTKPSAEEEEQLQNKIADIRSRSKDVFTDVQDDFCDVKKILSRFEEWRASYSDSYHNAYISLCLPKLLNPVIRHQLLMWNPLKDASDDFENLPWFTALETFCHGHGHQDLEPMDRQTLTNVTEKTVLPKITAFVELVWDPTSHQQSLCLSDVCHRLKEDYSVFEGDQTKPVKALVEAVVRRLRSCVDEDVFIPIYPKKFLEDRSSPQSRFRDQQFWAAIKLLGNMGKWDLLLPESVLKELMLDKLLNRYLMITLCSQTQSTSSDLAFKKIADSLPLSWFKGENSCLPQLQNFENQLVQKIHSICKQQSPKDPNTRSVVVELLQVLSRIRCNNSIMTIAEKYHYEDVIYSHQLLNQETE